MFTAFSKRNGVSTNMKDINPNRIKFYEFLNGEIDNTTLENWVYKNIDLEREIPENYYIDLISISFKSEELKDFISKLVQECFNWQEYERWRTIKVLQSILNDEIEIVTATRKLKDLYVEQEEKLNLPLISFRLGVIYESILEDYPTEYEYPNWNRNALIKQLDTIKNLKEEIRETTKNELTELLKLF
jgi:hypothetical protein